MHLPGPLLLAPRGPHSVLLVKCLAGPGPAPDSAGSVAQRAVGVPAVVSKVRSGCGGRGYLVFWRSSRSQVGSVWPILYSSLESSMLWSR